MYVVLKSHKKVARCAQVSSFKYMIYVHRPLKNPKEAESEAEQNNSTFLLSARKRLRDFALAKQPVMYGSTKKCKRAVGG